MDDHGVIAVSFIGRTYAQLRIRAESTSDAGNAAIAAKWWYVGFR